jgi:hypothetical protein
MISSTTTIDNGIGAAKVIRNRQGQLSREDGLKVNDARTRKHPDLSLTRRLSAVHVNGRSALIFKIVKLCHLNVMLMVDVKCDALYSGVRRSRDDDTGKEWQGSSRSTNSNRKKNPL